MHSSLCFLKESEIIIVVNLSTMVFKQLHLLTGSDPAYIMTGSLSLLDTA